MFLNKIDIPYCCLPASPAVLKRFRRVSATLVFHPGGGTPIDYLYGYVPPKGVVILKLLI